MKQVGTVEEVSGSKAKVRIARMSSCGGDCGSCGGCDNVISVEAQNPVNAKSGDRVELEMPTQTVMGAALLVYVIPIIALIAGYAIGAVLFKSETLSILIGLVAMVASFCAISLYSRIRAKKYSLIIKEIIKE